MCLFRSRPEWEEDVVFANRRHRRPHSRVVSETVITSHSPRPSVQYIQPPPPRTPTPVIVKPVTTPTPAPIPSPPSPARIELVSVQEDIRHTHTSSPRSSRVSVSQKGKSRHGRGRGEEVYIERERERVRMPPPQVQPREDFETYRYVPGSGHMEGGAGGAEKVERRRSRSITYESNPRASGRVSERERERVVIEDEGQGRRREYYRRP